MQKGKRQHIRFENLTNDRLKEAAALAADAFAVSPAYYFILPHDADERRRFLVWLFERNFWLHLGTKCCRCTYEGDKLVAFFMFVLPGDAKPSLLDLVRAGLLGGLCRFGIAVVQRLWATKSWFEAKKHEVFGNRRVISLERMTVLPSHQGRGVGTQALGKALEEADELGMPVVLATQERINVKFYSRLGFQVVDETRVDQLGGYTNWMMMREPRVSRTSNSD